MKHTPISVKHLYTMTKESYDAMFNKHVKEFYKEIMVESKKGHYTTYLCPRDYEDNCCQPLRVVFDAIEHIKTLFKGIQIVTVDDNGVCDGDYFEADWSLEVVTAAAAVIHAEAVATATAAAAAEAAATPAPAPAAPVAESDMAPPVEA